MQEIDSGFDFAKVERILISDPITCPFKEGYKYINVLLFTSAPLPLILPYVYEATPENTLRHWMFINSNVRFQAFLSFHAISVMRLLTIYFSAFRS
jgi:hypothetical protein